MPRTGKGGKRTGASGTAYSNRSDLNTAMPVTTVPGQPYGVAAQQRAAQQAVPMGPTPIGPAAAPAPAAPAAPATPTIGSAFPVPSQPLPGELPWLSPSDYPDEPVTAGVDFGPGPGSEALSIPPMNISRELAMMNQVAAPSALLMDLARAAAIMGL